MPSFGNLGFVSVSCWLLLCTFVSVSCWFSRCQDKPEDEPPIPMKGLIKNYGRISHCSLPWTERGLEIDTMPVEHEPWDFEESIEKWFHQDSDGFYETYTRVRIQVRILLVQVSNPNDIQIRGNPRVKHVIFVDPAPSNLTTLLMMPWEYVVGKALSFQRWAFPLYPHPFGSPYFLPSPSKYLQQFQEKPASVYDFITQFEEMHKKPLPIRDYYCAAIKLRSDDEYRKITRSLVMLGVVLALHHCLWNYYFSQMFEILVEETPEPSQKTTATIKVSRMDLKLDMDWIQRKNKDGYLTSKI